MTTRALVVVALLAVVAIGSHLWRRRHAAVTGDQAPTPPVPAAWLAGERTWLVFTTPFCATCGPVIDLLTRTDTASTVTKIDATEEVGLAERLRVRAAPTAVLAGADGAVLERLVGADAVRNWASVSQGFSQR